MTPTMEIIDFPTPALRAKCVAAVQLALARGTLVRPSACAWCDDESQPIQGHHPDYARPLMVVWLCVSCHRAHHQAYAIERRIRRLFEAESEAGKICAVV